MFFSRDQHNIIVLVSLKARCFHLAHMCSKRSTNTVSFSDEKFLLRILWKNGTVLLSTECVFFWGGGGREEATSTREREMSVSSNT